MCVVSVGKKARMHAFLLESGHFGVNILARGQETLIGKRLGTLAAGVAGVRATSVLREIPMPAAVMARLHAMNIATWKNDPFMLETHGLDALDRLEGELKTIAYPPRMSRRQDHVAALTAGARAGGG